MTTTNPDITAALQRLDQALESPRVLAKQAIAEHHSRSEAVPWVNVTTGSGAPLLRRDSVLHASEPQHAPNVSEQRRRGLLRRLLGWKR